MRFEPVQASSKDTAPAQELNAVLAREPLEAGLRWLITYNGPGSWKRNAFWDEYVVSLRNPGPRPLTVSSLVLLDYTGASRSPGHNPWALEKEFNRRQLVLPLTLAPGESRTGSLFFPMVPGPRSLNLQWSDGPVAGEAVLPLDFLRSLHLQSPAASTPSLNPPTGG